MSPEPHAAPNRARETAPTARTVLRTVLFMTRHLQGVIEQLLPVIRHPSGNGWVRLSIRYRTTGIPGCDGAFRTDPSALPLRTPEDNAEGRTWDA
jgi:hypothetical protein